MEILENIKQEIKSILEANQVYLYDIVYEMEKNEWYLRIFIEKYEGNLDMDTCVAVSESISEKLDEIDVIKEEYYLEVSSPGAEKELKTWQHIQESVGKYVYMKFRNPIDGFNEIYGTIIGIENDDVVIEYLVKNIKKKTRTTHTNIKKARLAIKF